MSGTLRGELPRSGGISADPSRTRQFTVISDDRTDYETEILATVGLPSYNDLHPDDPTLRVRDLRADQDRQNWWVWTVKAEYKQPDPIDDPDNEEFDNPLNRLPEITIDTQSMSVAARGEVDSSGNLVKAIKNSAGEPYDPHPEEDVEILVIQITRWASATFSMALYEQYQNAVNDANWTFGDITAAEGEAKVRLRIGKREFWKHPITGVSITYRQYDFEIMVSRLGWDIELLDWGSAYKEGADSKKFVNYPTRGNGNEFGLLNGAGGRLPDGDDPVYLTWANKRRVDFGLLNLPTGP